MESFSCVPTLNVHYLVTTVTAWHCYIVLKHGSVPLSQKFNHVKVKSVVKRRKPVEVDTNCLS